MKVEKIKVDRASLALLMMQMREGLIRVPRFQRDFVWERKKIQELLDSIYKEYPIGTIFLWEAPSQYNHLLRTVDYLSQPPIDPTRSYSLIVDGQQRLTALYVTVNGLSIEDEDYHKIVVDLAPRDPHSIFQYREPDNKRWVSVRDLMNNDFTIYNSLPSDEHKERFARCYQLLSNYPFSVVEVRDMDIEQAVEIFERINRAGRRLSRYDLITASILDDEFDLRERTSEELVQPLQATRFGEIEETSITQALALNIRGRTESATQMELTKDDVKRVWADTVKGYHQAVEYVRSNLGVRRADFLPYDGMLPILAYYFFHSKLPSISGKDREHIDRWFWRVAFSERYSSASQTRMSEDALWIRGLVSEGKPYEVPVTTTAASLVETSMTYTTSAVRNGILCLLALQGPLDLRNGTPVTIDGDYFEKFNASERHHIFPVGFLRRQSKKADQVHRIPNFCFIPEHVTKWIGDRPPSQYMPILRDELGSDRFDLILRANLIPSDAHSGLWRDDYERFLVKRAELIMLEIKRRCGISDAIPEEVRNPVIDLIESSVRRQIHETLRDRHGLHYWHERIPKKIASKVEGRIADYVRKTPGTTKGQFDDPERRLVFCDILDYQEIFSENWSDFVPAFRAQDDLRRYFTDFNAFRNASKHNRPISALDNARARTAILWLGQALDLDLTAYGFP